MQNQKKTGDRMEIRNVREIREYVAEIRDHVTEKRAETIIRRLIVLKTTEDMNPFLRKDIDFLIKVVNEPDDEYRNMVCDIVEHTLDNIRRGRY